MTHARSNILRPAPSSARRRGGFTLTELLVVIGLIVILIAVAVPSFRFLTGNRSLEGGSNVLGAMLARARADAVGLQEVRGVAVYRDRITGRTAAAFLAAKPTPFETWTAGTAGTPVVHAVGDYVISAGNVYVCISGHTDTGSNAVTDTTVWRPINTQQYGAAVANSAAYPSGPILDLVADRDRQFLPVGVSVRGAGDTLVVSGNGYRYYNPFVVLFDANGSLVSRSFYIFSDGLLGVEIDSTKIVPDRVVGTPAAPLTGTTPKFAFADSQIGFVLFDEETYLNATAPMSTAAADQWIDENATPILVNRYNGTLVKGE